MIVSGAILCSLIEDNQGKRNYVKHSYWWILGCVDFGKFIPNNKLACHSGVGIPSGKSWIRYWFNFPPWHLLVHNIPEQMKTKVKIYSPFDLFEYLVSMISLTFPETRRKAQETEADAQETGRKLQVLMDAVNSCSIESQCSGPRPVSSNATTSALQQTISAQRQLQWQQSSQGRNLPSRTSSILN